MKIGLLEAVGAYEWARAPAGGGAGLGLLTHSLERLEATVRAGEGRAGGKRSPDDGDPRGR